ncbi:hypothetical protein XENTR_v10020853 [Xenopus tropicalis]|uniref:Glutamine amidotransferase-like class 1 domain-containing protein 3A, mitochondrial n=1 Tax=Xenopus tropicalis TaxID=8364 RepID=A0A8J0QIP3_XENTR|nr:glutamine amidotransferase-like class 1 domain-containing protein 3A, mitochondrial [Xenopus tropicalis]KAE8584177.1 hypothetical protein XENTR_v10020853 [Xenopus tropicalis]|eukprot:XP_002931855.2 PREDICTED: ES1 protein homolog, mitochondrial-like [Xenopus tropicalis]
MTQVSRLGNNRQTSLLDDYPTSLPLCHVYKELREASFPHCCAPYRRSTFVFAALPEAMAKKVAVILAGCGVYDGSEIHESSAVYVHLSRAGAQTDFFAPNTDQMHVVSHTKGQPTKETRNVLEESARIARGNIKDLKDLDVSEYDAVIIPGGFGVAKNLSTWAVKGKDCSVAKEVEAVIKGFHGAKKPIGLCCISPVLAAKLFPGCELTVGCDTECEKWPYAGTAAAIKELGCKHVNKQVSEVHVDAKNKLVTTSAFMCNSPVHEIYDGIGEMVKSVLQLTN